MDEICDFVSVIHQGDCLFTGTPAAMRESTGEESLEKAFLNVIGHVPRVLGKVA
jgi:ABC-type Na+ transport system ATPase subunit NatA